MTLLLHNVVSFVHHHFRSCCNVLFGHELWLQLFIMFYTMAERFWISCLLFLPCCSERFLILSLCFSFVLCIVPFFSSCHSMSFEAMLFPSLIVYLECHQFNLSLQKIVDQDMEHNLFVHTHLLLCGLTVLSIEVGHDLPWHLHKMEGIMTSWLWSSMIFHEHEGPLRDFSL